MIITDEVNLQSCHLEGFMKLPVHKFLGNSLKLSLDLLRNKHYLSLVQPVHRVQKILQQVTILYKLPRAKIYKYKK